MAFGDGGISCYHQIQANVFALGTKLDTDNPGVNKAES